MKNLSYTITNSEDISYFGNSLAKPLLVKSFFEILSKVDTRYRQLISKMVIFIAGNM